MSTAVQYLIERMLRDPRLAWLIGPGSQAYEYLVQEEARRQGTTEEKLRAHLQAMLRFEPWPGKGDSLEDDLRRSLHDRHQQIRVIAGWVQEALCTLQDIHEEGLDTDEHSNQQMRALIESGQRLVNAAKGLT